jgi:serine/threonine protein kinase
MHRYEKTLESFASNGKLSKVDCLDIIYQLIDIFKIVHLSKRTYNDLKLANIMINTRPTGLQVVLIDYGFSTFFVDKDGNHIDKSETVETFQGNLLFASLDQLNFKMTTRRDDMISLAYLFMFLFNGNDMPCLPSNFYKEVQKNDILDRYKRMFKFKGDNSL